MSAAVDPGLFVVGELLKVREDREARTWVDASGASHAEKSASVSVLVGTEVVRVQYRDAAAAASAVGAAASRDVVRLRVVNKHGVKDGKGWQFYAGLTA